MSSRASRRSRFLAMLSVIGGLTLTVPAVSAAVTGETARATTVQPATCTVDQKLGVCCISRR
jgi:hypothetical protein